MSVGGTTSRIGAGLVAAGAVLVLLAIAVLPWFHLTPPTGFYAFAFRTQTNPHFSDVHDAIVRMKSQFASQGISRYISFNTADTYFSWLAWAVLLVSVALGALAVSPFGDRYWTPRWASAVVAFAGGALTIAALDLVSFAGNPPANALPPSLGDFVRHAGLAPWVTIAGYALILAGSFVPHHD